MSFDWAEDGRMNVLGRALEYACLGPAPSDAPTLVLLHEGLGCVSLWRDFPQQLQSATGLGVLAYSRAGYGKSDPKPLPWPLDYMTREACDVLPEALDLAGIEKALLVGHSDGATIAAIHAGRLRDPRVRGVALMAPHFFTEKEGLAEIAKARIAFAEDDLREKLARHHSDPDNAFRGWNESWLHPDFEKWNVAEVLDDITVPVLAIQGRQDQYGTLAQIDVIADRCPTRCETLVLDECRHSPFRDQGEKVVAAIAQFAKSLEWK